SLTGPPPGPSTPTTGQSGEPTGRYLVVYREGEHQAAATELNQRVGASSLVQSADFAASGNAVDLSQARDADGVMFRKLSVAVGNNMDAQQVGATRAAAADEDSVILAVEPERYTSVAGGSAPKPGPERGTFSLDYLRGFRDAVAHLYDVFSAEEAPI